MTEGVATLVVDLGGTWMRAGVVDAQGTLLVRRAERTPGDASCPDALVGFVGQVRADHEVGSAVIGVPGRVDYDAGRLEYAPNLPAGWADDLTVELLSRALGIGTSLANDADLAAVGEARLGAGRGFRDVAYLTISTGVGAGIVLGGRVAHGGRSIAEVGHTIVDVSAVAEGRRATLEDLGSGTAMARRASEVGLAADAAEVMAGAEAGDASARDVRRAVVEAVAVGAVNLAHMFAPDVIVLGGGVGRSGEPLLGVVRDLVARHGPQGLARPIEVVTAALGDDAGLIGGAVWADAFADDASSAVPRIARRSVPALTAEQMRAVDRVMVEELHVGLVQMMENAGRHLAELALRRFHPASVTVLSGPGGNGGGGLVAARHLAARGATVRVTLSHPEDGLGPVTAQQLDVSRRMCVPMADEPVGAELVIDAIIGYGLRGDPTGRAAELIGWANRQPSPVLALDAPSGLDVTTGQPSAHCVQATATLTLALPKTGLLDAPEVGDLYLADISVPPLVYQRLGIDAPRLFEEVSIVELVP